MKKYNLGKKEVVVSDKLSKNELYVDEKRAVKIEASIEKNLELISDSMLNIEKLLSKTLNTAKVSSSRVKIFKLWARKCKSQANSAETIKNKINESFNLDLRFYPIKLLDDRINELSEKIALLEKNEGK
jgi:hypothetical protein